MPELDEWQEKSHAWRKTNFPNATATDQLLGVGEEVGELMHHHLKQSQGIRGSDSHHESEARDAVGDILIYLMGYCSLRHWSMRDCLGETLEQVMGRDWISDPVAGGDGYKKDVAKAKADGYDWS